MIYLNTIREIQAIIGLQCGTALERLTRISDLCEAALNGPGQSVQRHVTTQPRDKGAPPSWLRCDVITSGRRCLAADGHMGEHVFTKETT